jgi:large-conductance mechanosensitive channel
MPMLEAVINADRTSERGYAVSRVGRLVALGAIANLLPLGTFIAAFAASIFGGVDFSNYFIPISSSANLATKAEAVLGWGLILTVILNFLIVLFILFSAVRLLMRLGSSESRTTEVRLASFHQTLRAHQEDLGKDVEKAVFNNVWDLYAR